MAIDVGSAVGYLDLDISGFSAGLKSANSEATKEINNLSTNIGKGFEAVGSKLTSAGKTLVKNVTLPIVGLGTLAIKTSAEFESAMSKVSAISGATGNDLDMLNKKAQEMGAKTKFSATESAEAFTYMAMAGWKTEDMLDGISGIMSLAAADGLDLATTSDIVTDALTAFGLGAKDSGHFADVLAKASSSANTNVSLLGESFKYVAPVAGALGMSAEDVGIALGLMGNAGIKGSQAGTALRASLTRLIKPTDTAADLMEQYNLSMTNSDGTMKSLSEVMNTLRKNLGGLTEAEQAQVAATIFGQESMSGMLSIINASEKDYNSLTKSIYDAEGAAQQMADTMLDNLSGQIVLLKSALEGLAIQFGEILMPYIKRFTEWLQNLITKFQEMTPEQQNQVVQFAAIAAAIGPVLLIFGKLITSVGNILTTFGKIPGAITKLSTALAGITAPIAAIIAAVAVLVAAFVTLWKNNEEFRDKMTGIWEEIKGKFEGFIQGVVDRVNELGFDFESIVEIIKEIWNGFCEFFAPAFESGFQALSNVLDVVFDVLLGLLDIFVGLFTGDWEKAWEGVKGIFVGLWDFLQDTLTNALDYLFKSSNTFLGLFGTSWEELWDNVSTFFEEAWRGISDFFENTWNGITEFFTKKIPEFIAQAKEAGSGFLDKIVEFFTDLPYKIGFFIGESFVKVGKWALEMEDKAKETAKNFLESIVKFFKELPGKVADHLTTSYKKAKEWSDNMRDKAIETGKNFLESIVSFFKELPGKLWNYFNESNDKAKQWVLDMGNRGLEAIRSLINNVVDGAMEIPQKMADIGRSIVTGVWDGISGAAKWLTDQVSSFFTGIVNGVKSGLGIGSPSKVFAEKVGKWLPAGVAVGFKSALPDAMKSMQTDLDKSTISLNTDFYTGVKRMGYSDDSLAFGQAKALMQSGQSASHSKNDIKIDISVNANVANDYDVRNLANELGVSVERELRSRGVAAI